MRFLVPCSNSSTVPMIGILRFGRFITGRPIERNGTAAAEYLYPLATSGASPEAANVQVLELYQKNIYRKDEEEKKEQGTMLFPFYISGSSAKYGPYTSVFPFTVTSTSVSGGTSIITSCFPSTAGR